MRTRTVAAVIGACVLAGTASIGAASAQTHPSIPGKGSHKTISPFHSGKESTAPSLAGSGSDATWDFQTIRISGTNRWKTAAKISKATFPDGTWGTDGPKVDVVTITSGTNFPDALAAGPFANGYGPILLVPATGTLPAAISDEITRLAPSYIAVVGGDDAVSTGIQDQIAAVAPGATIDRYAGATRYETAAIVAESNADAWAQSDPAVDVDTVLVATGQSFADSLGGGTAASYLTGSLVLTPKSKLHSATAQALTYIDPSKVYVLGGAAAIDDSVVDAISALLPSATVTRVAGKNRYATAAQLAQMSNTPYSDMVLASGANFPDALAAGAVVPYWGAGLFLTKADCVPGPTMTAAMDRQPPYVIGVGGYDVVSDAALQLNGC